MTAGTAALGTAFFLLSRARPASLRVAGPSLLGIALCTAIVIVVHPTSQGYTWVALQRRDFLDDMFGALGFLLSFVAEAVLLSHVLIRLKSRFIVFLPAFLGLTMLAWFLTFLAWASVVED